MTFSSDYLEEDLVMSSNEKVRNSLNTALQLREALASGSISANELTKTVIENIKASDTQIKAFAYVDEEGALREADRLDAYRITGKPLGPLHGVPVALKDIIDVKNVPCERGSDIYKDRIPQEDAYVVSLLREAGAVIIGKTITTEMAYFAPGPTHNPHNLNHTPGGSSSGSAASVAAGMVSLSLGTQTNGSMIRPASFCGVFAYKPSYGRISRKGILRTSGHLDTVGLFARSLEDLALLGDVVMAYDQRDEYMEPQPKPQLAQEMQAELIGKTRLAFMRTPYWDKAEESTKDAFRELIEETSGLIDIVDMPPIFDKAHEALDKLMSSDFAKELDELYQEHKDQMSSHLIEIIDRGQKASEDELKDVHELRAVFGELLETYFDDYDAILTPSSCGQAPKGLESTGDPGFSTIWQLAGLPCLNLPIFEGPDGLPFGAQLVGQRDRDGRLFAVARHFLKLLGREEN